jgi:hypothetical protein
MLPRLRYSTGSASLCPSACALLNTSCRQSLPLPESRYRASKCSADFSAEALICLEPTLDSAQVGLGGDSHNIVRAKLIGVLQELARSLARALGLRSVLTAAIIVVLALIGWQL